MSKIIEITLVTTPAKTSVGKAFVDESGRFKIIMEKWVTPTEMKSILSFLQGLTASMALHSSNYHQKTK
jgi:hypothetical protein